MVVFHAGIVVVGVVGALISGSVVPCRYCCCGGGWCLDQWFCCSMQVLLLCGSMQVLLCCSMQVLL